MPTDTPALHGAAAHRAAVERVLNPSRYNWPEAIRDRVVRLELDEHWIDDRPFYNVLVIIKHRRNLRETSSGPFGDVALQFVDAFDAAGLDGTIGVSYLTEAELKEHRTPYDFG